MGFHKSPVTDVSRLYRGFDQGTRNYNFVRIEDLFMCFQISLANKLSYIFNYLSPSTFTLYLKQIGEHFGQHNVQNVSHISIPQLNFPQALEAFTSQMNNSCLK
ncbi:hypothetical protein CHS0354_042056 [Potamilus streckersoni]|uniref:Uncharacterized protein n=1 Tax=Potamilus streckersoni TaxID=2493646 RepID=A0AAE0W9I5_9BIVA|nr:hypothetical protein CHS0354_042056 [Potamilus streckersoni]